MIKRLAPVLLIPFFVLLFSPLSADAASRSFNITAKQWSFTPSTITVTEGDVVTLNVTSVDVSHGLAISQFGVNIPLSPGVTASATFTANKAGTYSFFCNVACGQGHGGMRGTLTVQAAPVVTNTNSSTNTNTSTTTNTNTGTTNTNTTSVNTSQSATTNTSTTTTETSTPAVTDPVAEAEAVNELELSQDEPRTVNGSTNQSASTDVSTDINKKTTLPNANNQLNVAVADASTDEPNGSSSALGIGLIVVGVVVFGGVIFFGAKKKSNN
ncbi:cupredoxin domain-containing protein [Patescibacteria group bacterium]|nr:cupredoxin domain-containing protein [Patescibacteria group bacterium]